MTMPKKGRRKIVVAGETYYYKLNGLYTGDWPGVRFAAAVVVQTPSNKILRGNITSDEAITPKDVRKYIVKNT
jgi:hypothetical protein